MIDYNSNIKWVQFADKKAIRKWVIAKIQYDYESDGYCVKELKSPNDGYCEFGSPFDAYKHAKTLVGKYKKIYPDVDIIIEEQGIKVGDSNENRN